MLVLHAPNYGQIEVPFWVIDLQSFRRWAHSGELPEKLKVHFINGRVWIDIMGETFNHNQIKLAVTFTLSGLIQSSNAGILLMDGMALVNEDAELGCEPDVMFVSAESLATSQVTFKQGKTSTSGITEVIGSPDMVLEVISPSSVVKDTEWLMTQYHDAGVKEYWVIDSRAKQELMFTIYNRTATEFVPVRKARGWMKSTVLGKSFQLVQSEKFNMTQFQLEVK